MGRTIVKKSRRKPTAIDCFAGCGGMTLGLKQAGYDVVGAIEIDKKAAKVYAENHKGVLLWEKDISKVKVNAVKKRLGLKVGELDLLGGCPPCQGFSTLRTYNGGRRVRDKQNDLIFEFQRLILGLKPKRVMMENVPGLYDDNRFNEFKAALEDAEYTVKAMVLDAADYGVPQRRRRLVLLASKSPSVYFARRARRRRTVKDAIGKLRKVHDGQDPLHELPENRKKRIQDLIAAIPKNGGSRSSLPKRLQLKCHKRSNGFKDVYGRMAWNKPAPTITTGCFNPSKGRFLHPTENRAITMREASLLQSFPPNYIFPVDMGKVRVAAMIGNALPPEFIRRHASIGMHANKK